MFFMQSAVVTEQTTLKEITRDKFEKNSGNVVDEVWLKAVHVQPALPSPPVRKGTQVGSLSRPLRSDGENINYMLSGSNELLRIEPTEFRFAFEKNKSISGSIQLTNITDNYIAFKIKAKVPDHMNYHLSNTGIVPPRSTHDYIVTLKAQSEVPPDCNKMFFMQCATVTEGTTLKEITKDKFQRNSGKVVDELWLKAVHAQHPPPQPPVRKGSQKGSSSHHLQSDGGNINYSKDFFTPTESTLHSVPLQHLKDITNNFCDERQIGRGGFGVVYKGVLGNENVVAVKKFLQSIMWSSEKQFENEINLLRQLEHRNIVRLLGFCYETKLVQKLHEEKFVLVWNIECLICLEYLSKGSLNMYISDASSGLDWPQRFKIIQGVSYGLQYLHQQSGGPIIHLDLKPGNILLDENMLPKITDFGLSRLFDQSNTIHTLSTHGTFGYMAPEHIQGIITPMSDIFGLGVLILEVITGQKGYPYDIRTNSTEFIELELQKWRKVLQKEPGYTSLEADCKQIRICIQIGLICVNPERTRRPTTKKVVDMLEGLESMDFYISNELTPLSARIR
ncbi:hypothetical protein QYE76_034714 [Lolium multiflorum]|uniref:non-specific serine/threonine protein kinase n=1 Tax=Lolium multiflorum TaxID=4521 RepID=A0AAD8QY97_LOLMU|nr:hypothetical protein QYE76_034714 [Lolium multiflorum]